MHQGNQNDLRLIKDIQRRFGTMKLEKFPMCSMIKYRLYYPIFKGMKRVAPLDMVEYDKEKAYKDADFIYAKNWAAYRDPNYGKILSTDKSWTVDAQKMALTNNAFFMHCLPVRRNMIVTDDVIESTQSIVIPEAANRVVSAQTVLKEILAP